MAIITQPSKLHTAFNPELLEVSGEPDKDIVVTISVGGKAIRFTREAFNGVASFDMASVVKHYFKDTQDVLSNGIFVDNNLIVSYTAKVDTTILSFNAINAVAQIGESSDLTSKQGSFCTAFEKIRKYKGYDRTISVLAFDGDTYLGYGDTQLNGTPLINHPSLSFPILDEEPFLFISNVAYQPLVDLTTNDNQVITNNNGDIIQVFSLVDTSMQVRLPIINEVACDNPFYVRWINRQGGHDYWMFSHRQYFTKEIDDQETFSPVIYNQQTAKGTDKVVSMVGIEQVVVKATMLDRNEYECVSNLIYSPSVEWYNEKLGKWLMILVDKSSIERNSRAAKQGIEFTFTLPQPIIQI